MLEEQLKTIQLFRENYCSKTAEPLVIYGTGINAEAVVKSCEDYPIAGLMDVSKTGQTFWGKKVLSEKEVLNSGLHLVVVIARPAVLGIIYNRLKLWSEEYAIRIQDVYGNNIADRVSENKCESPYFDVSYENLIKEIDSHEIISFDIFDTVLMRRVYEPTDVFLLIDEEVIEKLPKRFSIMRKETEQELLKYSEPNIYQIYARMEEKYHLTQKTCHCLMNKELKKEKEILVVRNKIKECIKYCLIKKKRVFFVSDMYLPVNILRDFLNQFGIVGYEDILVSCEYQVSKSNGLFQILKEKAGGMSYLHIGDNPEADYTAAKENGMDTFLIMSAIQMMEVSSWRSILTYLKGIESRVMLGMLVSKVFNDPFILYASQGKPRIVCSQDFGFLLIAPLVLLFLVWMLNILENKEKAFLMFASRDGWLMQKAYHILKKQWNLKYLPKDIYFMISRKAIMEAEKEPDGQTGILYRKYIENLNISSYEELYFFDFMSKGTCQSKLEKLIKRKMIGLYVQKSISGEAEKDELEVKAYFKETTAYDNDLRIFAICDFLECIFSSFKPSFIGFNVDGSFIYTQEKRSMEQMEHLKEIHKGILEYCKCFSEIIKKTPIHMPSSSFCDEILKYTSAEFSIIEIPTLKEFMLDDCLEGDKNTGKDILS